MSVVGRVVVSILGLAGVPAAWLLIRQNLAEPWLAVVLFILFETVVALGAMVISVAHQTIRRRLEQVANVVDLALGRRVSRYARHYRRYVLEENAHLNARDLAHTPSHIPELDAVYVDVGLVPGSPSARSGGILPHTPDDGRERRPIHEFLDRKEPTVLAVIGAPGGGKTTLLRHTASRVAKAPKQEQRRRIPVLVALRDFAELISTDRHLDLAGLIREAVGRLAVAEPDGWWEVQLREGNCVVLLDGLDEVARTVDRTAVSEWIERQISKHAANDFVITSRPHGYQTAVIPQATVVQVRPLTTGQIWHFVHTWCLASERLATGKTGPEIDRRASEEAEDLLGQLVSAPALQELAVNPLLLTMMVLVHRERRALPSGRADLYNQVCDVMLWRRMESKKLEVKPSGVVRQRILAALAYEMMLGETRDFPRAEVVAVFDRMLQSIDAEVTAEALLESIVDSSGLLIERERDLFAFTHHTLCEYLASVHIRSQGLVSVLIREIENPWWRETILLYVTDTDASAIVEACLERDSGAALSLAFDCIRNHGQIHRHLRERLDAFRRQAFADDATPEHRLRVARALATGHFRTLVALENGTLVCSEPVPENLYWLFCRDTGILLPDGLHSLSTDTDRPALGMWRGEAERFVAWFNEAAAEESGSRFRIASADEVAAVPKEHFRKLTANAVLSFPEASGSGTAAPERMPFLHQARAIASIEETEAAELLPDAGRLVVGLCLAEAVALGRHLSDARSLDFDQIGDICDRMDLLLSIARVICGSEWNRVNSVLAGRVRRLRELNGRIRVLSVQRDPRIQERVSQLLAGLVDFYGDVDPTDVTNILDPLHLDVADRKPIRSVMMGLALDRALTEVEAAYIGAGSGSGFMPSHDVSAAIVSRFAITLSTAARLGTGHRDLEGLSRLDRGLREARTILKSSVGPSDWAAVAADRLLSTAHPILSRQVRASRPELIRIRTSALVLAAESELLDFPEEAEEFRMVADGASLLEDRLSGRAPLEVLFLARE
ncbi:NACHT domain-containing protein [Glycomyces albidus]|uniref:NACHT domain-containing protein n=1 Tax=Glycomyces albidus TaxID=2656774 RepID=A0A6L5G8L0_9ACTN|nr:NACHT domain-containing protein [Glycomyces albidus]MQM25923.1 NACHT domain-containing protein [Glycomyces albidus]